MGSSWGDEPSDLVASLTARIAANTRWSRLDEPGRAAATSRARSGFLAKFEREVDPDGRLAPEERQRRAQQALTAHMQRLALARAKKRRAATRRTSP